MAERIFLMLAVGLDGSDEGKRDLVARTGSVDLEHLFQQLYPRGERLANDPNSGSDALFNLLIDWQLVLGRYF